MERLVRGDEPIGEGAYGKVYRGRWCSASGAPEVAVAVKCIQKDASRPGVPHNACREIGMLKELHHPNIVTLHEVLVNGAKGELNVVLEWAEYDLSVVWYLFYHVERRPMPLPLVRAIMYQLLCGCEYMHAQWVMHRDIPANILITAAGLVKLADFGLARIFQAPTRPLVDDHVVVTHWYRAPELLLGSRHYTHAIDCWALGTVFCELILGCYMFPGAATKQAFNHHMVTAIFERLGRPAPSDWPTMVEMPFWPQAKEVSHAKGRDGEPGAELIPHAQRRDWLKDKMEHELSMPGRYAPLMTERRSMVSLILGLIRFDPLSRSTCRAALHDSAPAFDTGSAALLSGSILQFDLDRLVTPESTARARQQQLQEKAAYLERERQAEATKRRRVEGEAAPM